MSQYLIFTQNWGCYAIEAENPGPGYSSETVRPNDLKISQNHLRRFGEIQQHMQIGELEVEEFLIDVLKTKLVRAKIDQGNQVNTYVHLFIITCK